MVSKIRLGIIATTTAAGIYLGTSSQRTFDNAVMAPLPMEHADDVARESGPGWDEPTDGNEPPTMVPFPGASTSTPGAEESFPAPLAEEHRPLALSLRPAAPMHSPHPGAGSTATSPSVTAPEVTPSEIPQVAPRIPGGKDVVRVYYGTNRRADETQAPDENPGQYYGHDLGPLEFGVVEVSVPKTHRRGQLETRRWYLFEKDDATRHFVVQRVVPAGEATFLRELNRELAVDSERQMFVFVHGFGTSFEAAAWRTGQLKADLEFDGPAVMYSWPSRGLVDPISYFRDRDAVSESHDELETFLETIATQTGAEKIHVIAHSMGNYLLAPSLKRLKDRPYLKSPLFDELILAAPDISADIFEDEIAAKLESAARRTTIYAADNDYALRVSQVFHRNRRRLGTFLGIKVLRPRKWIEVVDTGTAEFRLFEVGHSDYAGPVLEDVKATIAGLGPDHRGLARHHLQPRYWEFAAQPDPTGGGVVPVGYTREELGDTAAPPSTTAAQSKSFWSVLTSWWPW